jgi:two-component system chemotaxis response regulator CheY
MKFLVVDDSSTIRRIIVAALQGAGYTDVDTAADGKEALDKCKADSSIDVVLSDWNMPVMNGYDFLVAFRSFNTTAPFLMVTTESEKASIVKAVQAGATNYVVKPFTPEILLEKISVALTKMGLA